MSTVERSLLLASLLTVLPVSIGVAVSDDTSPSTDPVAYTATPLADFDSTSATVRRTEFCDRLPAEAATDALGTGASGSAYGNGDTSDVVPGGDVSHEYGCRFVPTDTTVVDTEARAWVFAPPVGADRAQELVRSATSARGCRADAVAPAFGNPTLALQCTADGRRTASFRGLFGDAWLTCSLTLPATVPARELVDRAGRWCVAVARAASS